MYVKIVRYLDGLRGVKSNRSKEYVVPKSVAVIECKQFEYRKINVLNYEEFDKYMRDSGIDRFKIIGEWNWIQRHVSCTDLSVHDEVNCEFILISYLIKGNEDECEWIVAPDCQMYIMGNDGKTIDSLICN